MIILKYYYFSVVLCCVSNCIFFRQHIFYIETLYSVIYYMVRPFGHHQVLAFTVGYIANPLHWPVCHYCGVDIVAACILVRAV
jgi:hypothetical protein